MLRGWTVVFFNKLPEEFFLREDGVQLVFTDDVGCDSGGLVCPVVRCAVEDEAQAVEDDVAEKLAVSLLPSTGNVEVQDAFSHHQMFHALCGFGRKGATHGGVAAHEALIELVWQIGDMAGIGDSGEVEVVVLVAQTFTELATTLSHEASSPDLVNKVDASARD